MFEEFYKILNKSVASYTIFSRWSEYRKAITGFASANMWEKGSCIILGAGNLQDINLQEISKNSSELVLTDIDLNSVTKGIEMQGSFKNVSVFKADLGGQGFGTLIEMVSEYVKRKNVTGLKMCLDSYKFTSEFEIINYDNVMVSAVYTQLFIPQFLFICEKFKLEPVIRARMLEAALVFASKLISHVNDEIMTLAADDATVVVWSDVLEYVEGSTALEDIKKHINDFKWMEEFYQAYNRDFGYGLGSYGILDITQRIEIIDEKWLLWPFDENRTLVVKAISGRVTS